MVYSHGTLGATPGQLVTTLTSVMLNSISEERSPSRPSPIWGEDQGHPHRSTQPIHLGRRPVTGRPNPAQLRRRPVTGRPNSVHRGEDREKAQHTRRSTQPTALGRRSGECPHRSTQPTTLGRRPGEISQPHGLQPKGLGHQPSTTYQSIDKCHTQLSPSRSIVTKECLTKLQSSILPLNERGIPLQVYHGSTRTSTWQEAR
jgi:hypothetical protein